MDTLEFFGRVLPKTGWYVATIIGEGRINQRFFQSIEELSRAVLLLDESGHNTYMAVNSFKEKGNRRQDNVLACRSLYVDVDCGEGKPYLTQREGLIALKKFLKDANLPLPMIVSSGRGLHLYWPFERDVAPDEWKTLADALKRKTVEHKFEVDPVATADSARILRPVGTFNPKNGAIVKVLAQGQPTTYDTLRLILAPVSAQQQHMQVIPPVRKTTLLDNLAVKQEFPPGNADVIAGKCQQIQWGITHQSEVSEPFWYAMLGVAAYTIDPEATARAWSDQHPSYNEAHTVAKMQQWQRATGPSLCTKFGELRSDGCKGCIFKDRVKSPVSLGLQYAEAPPPEDAPVDDVLPMPWPFKRTTAGIKITVNEVDLDVCKFDVIPLGYGYDEGLGYETVRFIWKRPHVGWSELKMRQAFLTDGHRDFPSIIADQGIVLYNKKQTEHFQFMLRTYMDELRKAQTMSNLHATMGWKEKDTHFVLGNAIYHKDDAGNVAKQTVSASSRTARITEDLYEAKGNLQDWVDFTKVLDNQQMAATQFCLGVSFSSPLYHFTGLKGLTISLYGPTGSGKSLAQNFQQSVWGDPAKLHFTAKFTQNALFSRMALHNNLIFTVDEATMIDQKEIGDFVYWVTQGRDKARLSRSADERDARTWELPVTVSTNKSLASSIYSHSMDSDAQTARLLEITMNANPLFAKSPHVGRSIYNHLANNHGTAGQVLIPYYIQLGKEGILARIADAMSTFTARYGVTFTGQERFHELCIVLADLGNQIASEQGLIKYDWHVGTNHILRQLNTLRLSAGINKSDAFDQIGAYVADSSATTVVVQHTGQDKPIMDGSWTPRNGEIRVRYDVYRNTRLGLFTAGTITFDRGHFRKWLAEHGGDYKSFVDTLVYENALATPKSNKLCLGKDTPFRLPQNYVVAADLTHPRLKHLLNNIDDTVELVELTKLNSP